jgi:hypothetical protein
MRSPTGRPGFRKPELVAQLVFDSSPRHPLGHTTGYLGHLGRERLARKQERAPDDLSIGVASANTPTNGCAMPARTERRIHLTLHAGATWSTKPLYDSRGNHVCQRVESRADCIVLTQFHRWPPFERSRWKCWTAGGATTE